MKKFLNILLLIMMSLTLLNCGAGEKLKNIRKPVDLRKDPLDPDERARKNIREGKGVSIGGIVKGGKTSYEFSTSNPLWRATLDTLDFIPLATVDYSGGLIITDWYSDNQETNESIKITIRFLSNEIRSDAMEIKVFYKNCGINLNCKISEKYTGKRRGGIFMAKKFGKYLKIDKKYRGKKKEGWHLYGLAMWERGQMGAIE